MANLGANLGIFQPLEERIRAARVILRRNHCAQRCGGSGVGILISRSIDTAGTRLLDGGDHLRHLAPVLFSRDFQMKDLHWDVGFAADLERFVQRVRFDVAFIADVRGVDAALLGRDLGQRDQLIGLRVRAGSVDQRARQSHRAVAHGIVHHDLHLLQLVGGRSAVCRADYHVTNLRRAHIRSQIDRASLLGQALEILLQRGPIRSEMEVLVVIRVLLIQHVVGGSDGVAFAGDLGSDALRQLADRLLVDEQVGFRLAEHVDEAGRDDQTFGVDGALGDQRGISLAHECHAISDDADVGVDPGIAAAIDDAAIADEVVEFLAEDRERQGEEQPEQEEFRS